MAALLPPVGLPAVLAYRKAGVAIRGRLVGVLLLGFLLGAFGGARLAHVIASRELQWGFAGFLLLPAWRELASTPAEQMGGTLASAGKAAAWIGLPVGAAAGALSGLLGIGGGLVALPLLRRFGGLTRLEAQATTLAMLLPPIGLPAVYVYAKAPGGLPWPLLAAVVLGFALGADGGAKLAGAVNTRNAAIAYAALLAVLAILLAAQG